MDALLALDEAPDELSRPRGCVEARPGQWWGAGRERRHRGQAVIDGRGTTADARLTLTRLSPKERL
jgi:hypothetical protein